MKKFLPLILLIVAAVGVGVLLAEPPQPMFQATTSPDHIEVSWVNPSGATQIDVYAAKVACPSSGVPSGASMVGTVDVPLNVFNFTTGQMKATYCFYAIARDTVNGRTSVPSNTAQATFPELPLSPPQALSAIAK